MIIARLDYDLSKHIKLVGRKNKLSGYAMITYFFYYYYSLEFILKII